MMESHKGIFLPDTPAQTTWHVDATRHDDTGDGTGWVSVKKTIQADIETAANSTITEAA